MDHFIKFDGIDGESSHKDHKGEVEVLWWSWGLSAAGAASGGAGSGAGKPKPQEFTFTHLYDKASPVLARIAAQGRHIKQALVTARKSGEGQKDFLKIAMKEVFITDISQSADGESITEHVSFTSSHIAFEYRPGDAKGGLGSPTSFQWDIKKNKVE
jgi:type VI secretion system secreted protein Hcp